MTNLPGELSILFVTVIIFLIFVTFIIRSTSILARILGISGFTISFILMAFTTSLPELFLGLIAASKGLGELGIGIALGSNIVNLTLITGLIAVFSKKINTDNQYRKRQGILLFLVSLITVATLWDGLLTHLDGVILLISYFVYLTELWYSKARNEKIFANIQFTKFLSTSLILMISLTGLLIIGDVLINSSSDIAQLTGVFPIVIGSILISAVTAAPELLFEFRNIKDNLKRIALGDLMGAVGTNSTLVIGLIAIINPLTITLNATFVIILGFFVLSVSIFLIFLYTKNELDWWEGLILVNTYIVFLFLLFLSTVAF